MRALTGMLPWAIVLGLAVVAIWFLVERNYAAGRWLFAGLLVAHGLVHVLYLVPQPEASTAGGTEWPFDLAQPWIVASAGLDPGVAKSIGAALIAMVVVGFGASGLATLDLLLPAEWWPGLVSASAGLSLLLLALFFNPALMLGVAIDVILIWLALFTRWSPATG